MRFCKKNIQNIKHFSLTSSNCGTQKGAFTPDSNEALRANDLHVKSMQRHDRQSCGAIRANGVNYAARIERLTRHLHELRVEAENPKQQRRTKSLWLYVGTRSCIYIFVLLQKQEYILQRDWSCLAEAPPMTRIRVCCVVNFTREWREFHA